MTSTIGKEHGGMECTPWGERILWQGKPQMIRPTPAFRLAFWTLLVLAACAVTMFLAAALTLGLRSPSLLLFAAWCSTFAAALRGIPSWWHQRANYVITDRRVLWRRQRFGRSIERDGISFARIRWYSAQRSFGDLVLVRDVPTGALGRRLTVTLHGVKRPDLLWNVIRGRSPNDGKEERDGPSLPLGQRLVAGERVLWSERPVPSWRRWLPRSGRDTATMFLSLLSAAALVRSIRTAVPAARHVLEGGIAPSSPGFLALIAALSLSSCLLLAITAVLFWSSTLGPALEQHRTRYWITDQRVLIAQGDEELHLERERIVDVIDAPVAGGDGALSDLFLILDGPRARAVAVQGAFDEQAPRELRPVLRSVLDGEGVGRILRAKAIIAWEV